MAWASTVPTAIVNLVEALQASPDLVDTSVKDGPTVSGETLTEVVTVGFTDTEDTTSIEGIFAFEGAVNTPNREQYTIRCAASVMRGDGDMPTARTRVYQLFAAAGDAIAADKTLGGVVMSARPSEMSLTQTQSSKGAVATITFDVAVDAYTGR